MRNPCAGITRFRFYGSNLSPPISEHPLASSLLTGGKGIKKVWNRQNILAFFMPNEKRHANTMTHVLREIQNNFTSPQTSCKVYTHTPLLQSLTFILRCIKRAIKQKILLK